MRDQQDACCDQDRGGSAWAACGKPLVQKAELPGSRGLSDEATGEDAQDAVSHRLRRAVENPCLAPRDLGLRPAYSGKNATDHNHGFSTALVPLRRRTATTTGVVPFSIIKWSPFRLSRFRRGVQNGPLFDQQTVPFSIDKNKTTAARLVARPRDDAFRVAPTTIIFIVLSSRRLRRSKVCYYTL